MIPDIEGLHNLARRMHEEAWQDEGTRIVRPAGPEPVETAVCPGKCGARTRWRGPRPKMGSPGYTYSLKSLDIVPKTVPNLDAGPGDPKRLIDEDCDRAAYRVYKEADECLDFPLRMGVDDLVCWESALCQRCEDQYIRSWYASLWALQWEWPPPQWRGSTGKKDSKRYLEGD